MNSFTNNSGHIIWIDGQMIQPGEIRMVDLPQPEPVPEDSPPSASVAGEDSPKLRKK